MKVAAKGLLVAALFAFLAPPAHAQQAWLMTYGTADRVEEQFGHNAVWIRDPARGVDSVYNFGFFDFDKPGFYREFVFGEMIYFALAREPAEELAYYRWRDREVQAQLLELSPEQVRELARWLEARVQPETREFRYDYYFYNCSNRIRDGLDFALDGALSEFAGQRPAELNFRQHTRRMLADDPLLYLGVQAALGRPADRTRTRWEEMFLPEVVAEVVAEMRVDSGGHDSVPLVAAERLLYESTRPDDPELPAFAWGLFLSLLAASLSLIVGPVLIAKQRRGFALLGARIWIVASALAGLVLAFLWLGTDHQTAWRNENLLLFNPLALLLVRFRGGPVERVAAVAVAAGLFGALMLKLLPGSQWNHEMLLWLVPAQAALLWAWYRETPNDPRNSNKVRSCAASFIP